MRKGAAKLRWARGAPRALFCVLMRLKRPVRAALGRVARPKPTSYRELCCYKWKTLLFFLWGLDIFGIALTFSNRIYTDRYSEDRVTGNGLYQCNWGSHCSAQLLNLRTLSFTYRMSSGKNCTESVHFNESTLILPPEMTLSSLVPNSYILVSVSDFVYSHDQSAAQYHFWENKNRIFFAVYIK